MTTYTKETALYDTGAIAGDIAEAGTTASDYITAVTNDGIWVHPEGAGPVNGQPTANTSGWHISDAIELFRQGVSFIKMWVDNSVAKLRLGRGNESHVEIDFHSLKLIDKEGSTYFHVSDLRDVDGKATITDAFVGNGSTTRFTLSLTGDGSEVTVTVDGQPVGFGGSNTYVELDEAPASGSIVLVTYKTSDENAKAYTLGTRNATSPVGARSTVVGQQCAASGLYSYAEGEFSTSRGEASHAEGISTTASGTAAHAEGNLTSATMRYAHAEGRGSTASGDSSHAEGSSTAYGASSHAEGRGTRAYGNSSHAEGDGTTTTAQAEAAHAEGNGTTAWGTDSHAEGYNSIARGSGSHAEGGTCEASGAASHAEGAQCVAGGDWSHAQNYHTLASSDKQTALGMYNIEDANDTYAVIVGNGTADNARSNAFTVDWNGNVECGTVNGVDMADVVVDSDLTGYAKLTANTFTGTQAHKDGSIDRDGTIAAADDWTDTPLTFQDKNGELIGQIGLVERGTTQTNYDAGSIECMIRAFNENAGTQVENRITAGIARDGSCYYWVSDKAAFRTALSLGAAATMGTGTTASTVALGNHTHSNYYNSSTSRTANTFLAAPNGSNGAATFRAIVPADVPTLNQNTTGSAAKLTTARSLYVALGTTYDSANPVTFDGTAAKALPVSGTLGKARGGTGKTNTDTTYYGAKSLFSGTATTGTVTLSETAANYSMLLIQYRDNDSNYSSKLIISPNSKKVVLDMVYGVSGIGNLKSRTVTISGTSITTVSGSTMDAAHNGGAGTTNHIYITHVWGWK